MITYRNSNLFCTRCGSEYKISYPIPTETMVKKTEAFSELHKDCKQTYLEPKVDESLTANKKALWWISNGQVGMSSKTMWNCLIGNEKYAINHPYDPDDFSRCYKLLQTVPEWKNQLDKLKTLSKEWHYLVENWDKLTEMYEENVKNEWKTYKEIGMYEFMDGLLKLAKIL